MELCSIFGYGEICEGHYRSPSTLMSIYNKISDKKFIAVTISDKKEVYPMLWKFFALRYPITDEEMEPDEQLMRSIEEQLAFLMRAFII